MSKALATNVATVLVGFGLVLGLSLAFATPAKAQTSGDLQAQINALMAQLTALQGGSSACFTFTQNHKQGQAGGEVKELQKFLNKSADTRVSATGAGSVGNETSYFGPATRAAVVKFQNKYAADVLTPVGLSAGTGFWGSSSRAKANSLCIPGTPGTPTTPGTTPGTLTVSAGVQPANSLAPENASRVPFTTFTLTNSSASAVTVTSVTVQKTGLGDKAAFDGILLVDSNGMQLGNDKTLNSNNQAVLDAGIILQPGQSATLTVSGNMVADLGSYAGQVLSVSVVGINTTATVSGSLPIVGASHTLNSTLVVGGLQLSVGPLDPDTDTLDTTGKEIGTTGFVFASIRAQNTGSVEDVWIKSIRWNQSGSASASDVTNVVTVVDGVSYPTTVSADGKYYTAIFPGNGIEIMKGLQKEFSVKADIQSGPNRTIQFDLYKAADVYVVGETYGYGIKPTANATAASADDAQLTTTNPFFDGTKVIINAGTVSSVSRATEVAANTVVELSPNQILGGFAVDIKGEAITVASLTFGFDTSSEPATQLDNITLVDENGAVVAGPVDGTTGTGTDGKVTFTDTVTFPTGRHVFTLKGQLDSNFEDADTIQATTTPSTYWTTVRGATTGNTITLTNGEVSGNTMTVRAGQVAITINSTPAARTIVAGVSQLTVGSLRFDASASGENVRFSSIKVLYNNTDLTTTVEDPTNCYAYQGAQRLNNSAVNPTVDGTDYTFTFDTNLVVAKGTNTIVDVKCDIPSGAAGSFNLGLESAASNAATFTGTGVTSSQTITPTVPNTAGTDTAGNEQTIAGAGALTVVKDSSSPSYTVASGGTTGVTLGVLRFNGTNEDMTLVKVGLTLSGVAATSTPDDLTQVTLWDGATQVGTAFFSGTNRYATSTLTGSVVIQANSFKNLIVKGDLADIGVGIPGDSGVFIEVDYDGGSSVSAGGCSTEGRGVSSGQQICSTSASDTDVDGVRMFRSYPTVAPIAIPNTTLNTGTNTYVLTRFSVRGSASQGQSDLGIGLNEITVDIATSSQNTVTGSTSISNMDVYAFTDAAFSQGVPGFTNGLVDDNSGAINTGNNELEFSSIVEVPNATTYYFEVRGDVTGTSGTGTFGGNITTKLLGDAAFPVGIDTLMGTETELDDETDDNFVWTPNSTTTSAVAGVNHDWTNGYAIPGLPSSGLSGSNISK